ncbi:MAG: hypothetical protein WA060_00185 [Minisyncoccia bacterium]
MKSIKEILEGPEISNFSGSSKTRSIVEDEICRRWGKSELRNYDPLRSTLTAKNWILKFNMIPKKGEHAIRSFVVLETRDKKDPTKIVKRIKSVYLFHYRQVTELAKK